MPTFYSSNGTDILSLIRLQIHLMNAFLLLAIQMKKDLLTNKYMGDFGFGESGSLVVER